MKISLNLGLLLLLLLLLPVGASAEGAKPALKITELAVTTKIVKGNPIDSVHRISANSVKALYCFTRLTSEEEADTTITHVWYSGSEKIGEYKLPVKGKKWRTYSKKALDKGEPSDWRVEVLDADGKLLKTVKFRMN